VSENGCLCQREESHGGGSRRRSVLMLTTLSHSRNSDKSMTFPVTRSVLLR
jgi:hypothetical protein